MVLLRFCTTDVHWGSLKRQPLCGHFPNPRHHHRCVLSPGALRTSGKARLATLRNGLCAFRRRADRFLCSAAINEGRQDVEDMGNVEQQEQIMSNGGAPLSEFDVVEDWGTDPARNDWGGEAIVPKKKRGIIAAVVGAFVLIGGTLAAIQAIAVYKAKNGRDASAAIPPPVSTERGASENERIQKDKTAGVVVFDDMEHVIGTTGGAGDAASQQNEVLAEIPDPNTNGGDQMDTYRSRHRGAPSLGGVWDVSVGNDDSIDADSGASDFWSSSDAGELGAAAYAEMADNMESTDDAFEKARGQVAGGAARAAGAIKAEAGKAKQAIGVEAAEEVAAIKANTAKSFEAAQDHASKGVDAVRADTARAVTAAQEGANKAVDAAKAEAARAVEATEGEAKSVVDAMRAEAAKAAEAVIAKEDKSRAEPVASVGYAAEIEAAVDVELPPKPFIEIPGAVTEEQVAEIASGKSIDALRQRAMLAARASTVASEAARRAAAYATVSSKAAADAAFAAERGASATGAALAAMEIGAEEAIAEVGQDTPKKEAEKRAMKAAELAAESEKRAAEAAGLSSAHSDVADRQAQIAEELSQLHKAKTAEMIERAKSTVVAFWVETKSFAVEVATMLKQWVINLAHGLRNFFPAIIEKCESGQKHAAAAFNNFWASFNNFWSSVGAFFGSLATSIQNQCTNLGDFVQQMAAALTEFSKKVITTIGTALGKSSESISHMYDAIVVFFKELVAKFK